MITKSELAENIYNTITTYKNLFKNNIKKKQSNKEENMLLGINSSFSELYLENEFLSLILDDKQQSIKNIKLELENIDNLNNIDSLIDSAIENFKPLNEIDTTLLFFYDKVDKNICKEVIIEKYNNDYLKYWDLYVLMKNLGNNIINYRKALVN